MGKGNKQLQSRLDSEKQASKLLGRAKKLKDGGREGAERREEWTSIRATPVGGSYEYKARELCPATLSKPRTYWSSL